MRKTLNRGTQYECVVEKAKKETVLRSRNQPLLAMLSTKDRERIFKMAKDPRVIKKLFQGKWAKALLFRVKPIHIENRRAIL